MEEYIEKYLNRILKNKTGYFIKSSGINEYDKPIYETESNYYYYKIKKLYEQYNNIDIVKNRIDPLLYNEDKIYCYSIYAIDGSELKIYKEINNYL